MWLKGSVVLQTHHLVIYEFIEPSLAMWRNSAVQAINSVGRSGSNPLGRVPMHPMSTRPKALLSFAPRPIFSFRGVRKLQTKDVSPLILECEPLIHLS